MHIWIRNLWYKYSVVTAVELRILLQTALLRGWEGTQLCMGPLLPVVVVILFLCFVRDVETGPMIAVAALMLLVSRPSVGRKDLPALVWSEKTVVMLIWGTMIAYIWDGVMNWMMTAEVSYPVVYSWVSPVLWWVEHGILLIPCGIVPFSPIVLVIGLWLLDTIPGLQEYGRACYGAFAALAHSVLFFATLYWIVLLPATCLLIEILQYLFPLQLSRCFAALIIAPWYGAVLVSWYIYVRYQ